MSREIIGVCRNCSKIVYINKYDSVPNAMWAGCYACENYARVNYHGSVVSIYTQLCEWWDQLNHAVKSQVTMQVNANNHFEIVP